DLEKFAEEDHRRREAAEARNSGDQLAYQVDKALTEYGDKVPASDREELVAANDALKEALKGDDVEAIRTATQTLMQSFQKMGQAMYQAQQASAQAGQQAAAGGGPGGEGGPGDAGEG